MLTLNIKAELNNVTNLETVEPFEYNFKIQCTKCREIHDKIITININDKYEIKGHETNFLFHCSFCSKESQININKPKKFENYKIENNGELKPILEIDNRGLDLLEFIPIGGVFKVNCINSNNKFEEIELNEFEWYDYDDLGNEEVSITDVSFELLKK